MITTPHLPLQWPQGSQLQVRVDRWVGGTLTQPGRQPRPLRSSLLKRPPPPPPTPPASTLAASFLAPLQNVPRRHRHTTYIAPVAPSPGTTRTVMEQPLFRTLYGKPSAEKAAGLSTLNSLGQSMQIDVGRNNWCKKCAQRCTSSSMFARCSRSVVRKMDFMLRPPVAVPGCGPCAQTHCPARHVVRQRYRLATPVRFRASS